MDNKIVYFLMLFVIFFILIHSTAPGSLALQIGISGLISIVVVSAMYGHVKKTGN